MKRYLKVGLSVVIPFALVAQVSWWLYGWVDTLAKQVIPAQYGHEWWYAFAFLAVIGIGLVGLGFIFSLAKPVRWLKHKIDHYIINHIPVVNKVYNFGKDITDSFIHDIKEDGDLKVVEVVFAGQRSLGVLTDDTHHIIFVPTAPNPLNGFIMQTDDYHIVNMSFTELVQSLASLGRINGSKWKREVK